MVGRRLSSLRKTLHRNDDTPSATALPTASPPAQPPDPPATPDEPATIHKGAYVEVRLYLEGDQPPAQDFAKTAIQAARQVVDAGIAARATPLAVTVKKIDVDDDPPDADEAVDNQG